MQTFEVMLRVGKVTSFYLRPGSMAHHIPFPTAQLFLA